MCGIAGILDPGSSYTQKTLEKMAAPIAHRGPDDEGFHQDGPVSLAHRRLSIIDLDTGHQPIFNEDGKVAVVLNGEIYNFQSLRKELEGRGHRFATNSDTEVIVHLYEDMGERLLDRLEGMFAFALWDSEQGLLMLARDRFGIKPLCYYFNGSRLIFSSEQKALISSGLLDASLDMTAISHFLTFNYIPAPRTAYKEIKKLLPGHMILARAENGRVGMKEQQYYDLASMAGGPLISELEEAKAMVRASITDAVRSHMVSDVPYGAFLSGGIDSSIIVGLMAEVSPQPVKTFSIGYEGFGMFDETGYAREVASFHSTEHHEFKLSYRDILDVIPTVLDGLDEPFADWSIFPTYLVSRETRGSVKVALSGDGADEIFAGYRKYLGEQYIGYYLALPRALRKGILEPLLELAPDSYNHPVLERVRRARRFVSGAAGEQYERHYLWMRIFTEEAKAGLVREYSSIADRDPLPMIRKLYGAFEGDKVNRMLYTDMMFVLPYDMLVKGDSMGMLNSLEIRVPYLDHKVVENAFRLDGALKLRGIEHAHGIAARLFCQNLWRGHPAPHP
ncbi:MAG TPA: asparagine synthase (glutamine-hydrolyzing) [Nitrospirae bacterium]|nr:asparagine synthase (glutamine-hydrolyzing) [Nitrospirota bacterium]